MLAAIPSEVEVMVHLGLLGVIERVGRFGVAWEDLRNGSIACSRGLLDLLVLRDGAGLRSIEDIEPLVHPGDRGQFRTQLAPVGPSGQLAVHGEFRIIRPDGLLRWVRITHELKHDDAGQALDLVHMVFDISAARIAQERAGEVIRHQTELAHEIRCVSWSIPEGGPRPDASLWTELTGQLPHESAGNGWLNAIHPDDRPGTERAWRLALDQCGPYAVRHRMRLRSGEYRWFVAHSAPILNADGSVKRWVGACIDVHELGDPLHQPSSAASSATLIGGDHLRAARGLLNWSVRELASRAGVTPAVVRRMEEARQLDSSDAAWTSVRTALESGGAAFVAMADASVAVTKKARKSRA